MSYAQAREKYAGFGVNTDEAISQLKKIPLSLHCWQGNDVTGFDQKNELSGGIQATGNYPAKAKTPAQLMADLDMAFGLIPGKTQA